MLISSWRLYRPSNRTRPPGRKRMSAWARLPLILMPLLSGCAMFGIPTTHETKRDFDVRHHMIYIDGVGDLIDPRNNETYAGSEQEYVAAILHNFDVKAQGKRGLKLTVFIHGGLNSSDDVIKRADKYTEAMLSQANQYPVFICWDSAMLPNYGEHLFLIRRGKQRDILGPLSSPFVLLEDASRAISRIPSSFYKEYINTPATVTPFEADEEKDVKTRATYLSERHFKLHHSDPATGHLNYWTWINPVKVLTAPVVDGFGSGSWDAMLRRTDLVLSKRSAYEGAYVSGDPHEQYGYTAATRFLVALEGLQPQPQTTLIGHSMGAIIANNILARHPRINFSNVVFMGAAARIKDVENVLVPWLRDHRKAHFYSLSLDPYNEISENSNFDFGPRGSLLNWIDFTFGDVNSFKDRTFGSWWNVVRTAEDVFPDYPEGSRDRELSLGVQPMRLVPPGEPSMRDRVHLTRFAIGPDRGPQQHGEFDDYCFWTKRFWTAKAPLKPFDHCDMSDDTRY